MVLSGENRPSRTCDEDAKRIPAHADAVRFEVDEGFATTVEEVASELSLTIRVNGDERAHLACSPWDLESLAVGFLASEHVVRAVEDIRAIRVDFQAGAVNVEMAPDCTDASFGERGGSMTAPFAKGFSIDSDRLADLVRFTASCSQTYRRTSGVHSGLVIGGQQVLAFHEDVSRTNVLDRILGGSILADVPLDDKVILFSGRMSAMVVEKVAALGVSILFSGKAPTSLGIEMAQELGIALIKLSRDGCGCTVYSHPERVGARA